MTRIKMAVCCSIILSHVIQGQDVVLARVLAEMPWVQPHSHSLPVDILGRYPNPLPALY